MLSFFWQQEMDELLRHPFLLFLITIFIIWFLKKTFKSSDKKQPPSPPKLPILGNLHQLSPLIHRSFQSLGKKYGPFMLLHFCSRPAIIIQSPEAAMEIMKTNDLIFADKPGSITTRRLFYNRKNMSVAPYGEYWRKSKSICILQLLNGKRVQSFRSIREEETELLIRKIKSFSLSGSPVNLSESFMALTNDVVCRSAFGKKYSDGEVGKKFLKLLTELMQLLANSSVGEFIPYLSWIDRINGFNGRVSRVADEVDDFLEQVIQEHIQECGDGDYNKDETSRDNFVDILIKIHKENTGDASLDRTSIKAIILDILVGGTDTTSTTLEWAMTELLRHPEVLKKLQNEVRDIVKDGQDVTDADLEQMQYLEAVIKETLRYHTPIPFVAREAREDVTVMGYEVKAGTMVITNGWALSRDPAYWDEPETFRPERFLNSSVDFKGQDFEFIPFGTGRRKCPGIGFGMVNVELVLANLVYKFEWALPEGRKGEELDIIEQPGVTVHRKNPLFVVATHCYF